MNFLISLLLLLAWQQPAPQAPPARKPPLSEREQVTLADLKTDVGVDKRVIVMMAALNLAGYDYEPGGRAPSPLRRQLREDLKGANPAFVRKLRDYFLAHRKDRTDAAAVAPYLSLALTLTEPPAFVIETAVERLPEDVRELTDFPPLLEEFYNETNFSRLLPKYFNASVEAAKSYPPATAQAVGAVLSYLHTEPILELPPLYTSRPERGGQKGAAEKPEPLSMRERHFVVMPDLLNAAGAANLRVVRDIYVLLLGPTSEPSVDAVRRGFLRFVIDPLTERQVKEVAAVRGDLRNLIEKRGEKADPEYGRSAYYLITDSLVRAADARMAVRGMATRRKYEEADALYDLSLAYERGAVLVFHFYDQMKAYESAGVNLKDYYGAMLGQIDFEREAGRLEEYAQRLARHKQARLELAAAPPPATTISNADDQLVARILEADRLITERKYADARAILAGVHRERPTNARALFGLAEVTSKQASAETDSDRLAEQLYAAVEYYKLAAENASPETEKWLAQRSYVAAGKILDFLEQADDAAAAYDLALKLGEADKAAYAEAQKAKQQREQKAKP